MWMSLTRAIVAVTVRFWTEILVLKIRIRLNSAAKPGWTSSAFADVLIPNRSRIFASRWTCIAGAFQACCRECGLALGTFSKLFQKPLRVERTTAIFVYDVDVRCVHGCETEKLITVWEKRLIELPHAEHCYCKSRRTFRQWKVLDELKNITEPTNQVGDSKIASGNENTFACSSIRKALQRFYDSGEIWQVQRREVCCTISRM